jgi:hypothetical protein
LWYKGRRLPLLRRRLPLLKAGFNRRLPLLSVGCLYRADWRKKLPWRWWSKQSGGKSSTEGIKGVVTLMLKERGWFIRRLGFFRVKGILEGRLAKHE